MHQGSIYHQEESQEKLIFAEKLRNRADPDMDTNPSLEHRLQLLLQYINTPLMAAVSVSKTIKTTQSPRSFFLQKVPKWTKQVSQVTKFFKVDSTEGNREKL